MAQGQGRNAGSGGEDDREDAMDDLKEDVAEEVGVDPNRYGGNVPAKMWGAVGGHMVKRLIERGEQALADDEDDDDQSGGRGQDR